MPCRCSAARSGGESGRRRKGGRWSTWKTVAGYPRWVAGTAGMARSTRPLRRPKHHVSPHDRDGSRTQLADDMLPHGVPLFLAESLDRGPVTRAEHDVPKLLRVAERVLAPDGLGGRPGHPGVGEQSGEGRRGGDLVPRVERLVQGGRHAADGLPENAVRRLEQAWPPSGDGQYPARPDKPPHLRRAGY